MSRSMGAASKRAGENAEAAVLDEVPELKYVPDSEAEHYDARVIDLLVPSETLPFVGMCLLEVDTVVEIKSVMAVYGESQARGRFYLRQTQHRALLDAAGSYLFAVCEPKPTRPVIAMKVVPATTVSDLVSSWLDGGNGRPTYAQVAWSRVFDPAEVNGGESA